MLIHLTVENLVSASKNPPREEEKNAMKSKEKKKRREYFDVIEKYLKLVKESLNEDEKNQTATFDKILAETSEDIIEQSLTYHLSKKEPRIAPILDDYCEI